MNQNIVAHLDLFENSFCYPYDRWRSKAEWKCFCGVCEPGLSFRSSVPVRVVCGLDWTSGVGGMMTLLAGLEENSSDGGCEGKLLSSGNTCCFVFAFEHDNRPTTTMTTPGFASSSSSPSFTVTDLGQFLHVSHSSRSCHYCCCCCLLECF